MSSTAKAHMTLLVFGIILIVIGGALVIPASAWSFSNATNLASIGLDTYGVTLTMELYPQGSNTALPGSPDNSPNLICGSQVYTTLQTPSPVCYQKGLVGSPKDPWAVYDLTATPYAPGTTLLYAMGKLTKNVDGSAVGNVQIDISWYFGTAQASGWNPTDPTKTSFQDFPMTSTSTNNQGYYSSQLFQVPQEANGMKIVFFAEVYKGPYSAQTFDQSTKSSTAYFTATSEHYLLSVGTLSPTQTGLSVWVGQCSQTSPAVSTTCFEVWQDGKDMYGANPVTVTLPFSVVAIATVGPVPTAIYVHAKNMAYGSGQEENCFPAQMRVSGTGANVQVFSLTIGSLKTSTDCASRSAGSDTGVATGTYDAEFTTSPTPPWVQGTGGTGGNPSRNVLAIVQISAPPSLFGLPLPNLSIWQGVGITFMLFGVAVVGLACVPRKHP